MARILIDCTLIDFGRQPTGIPRVVLRYIEEGYRWAEATGHEVIPVVPTANGVWLCRPVPGEDPPAALVAAAAASTAFDKDAKRKRGHAGDPPHLIRPGAGDVLFCPSYWHDNDPQLYRDIKASGCKVVVLVHDVLPIAWKQFYNAPWRYGFAAAVLQAIGYANRLLCVSNVTKTDLEAFAARRGLPLPPTAVAHNGFQPLVSTAVAARILENRLGLHTSDAAARRALAGAGPAPLLMVGSVEPKKGHMPVVRCLEAMWAAGYPRDLVIIGRPGWMEKEIVDHIDSSPFKETKLFWLSGLDDFDLAYAYLRSHALVFASIAEGFGLPMIEAAMSGRPVVVLDTPIAREVLGGHGAYFEDAAALVRALLRLEDADVYAAARDELATFAWPAWSRLVPALFDDLIGLPVALADATGRDGRADLTAPAHNREVSWTYSKPSGRRSRN
ncbi:glycosyltransferase family 4 protein [uncultured Sphingomonas sp.]|uniref:glycosyltransferase family 4 protein n=1 Tax=uncultured Sphingomonas sp. TaxID=158754 RepID=UPI0035CB8101